jgi:tungstate transport system ATP-binding protein
MKTESSATLLQLFDAGVRFGEVQALKPLNLAFCQGEFVALVGANGSGKTSLLRLLHGLLVHTGRREVSSLALRQAMVFQKPFFLHLSVLNNLRIALWLAGVRHPKRTANSKVNSTAQRSELARLALQRVGLLDLRDRSAHALSGGQQQRLALARAWAVKPQILFLDEPTANLDPYAKNEVESLLQSFASEGMTLVMSTHNLGQAKRLASRVIYLEAGAVKVDLPVAAFFDAAVSSGADLFLKAELAWG